MIEEAMIRGRRRRLWRCDDRPEELATTTQALAEKYEPDVLTMTTEASIEEAEYTTRPSERLRRQRRLCIYGLRVLTTTTASSEE